MQGHPPFYSSGAPYNYNQASGYGFPGGNPYIIPPNPYNSNLLTGHIVSQYPVREYGNYYGNTVEKEYQKVISQELEV